MFCLVFIAFSVVAILLLCQSDWMKILELGMLSSGGVEN